MKKLLSLMAICFLTAGFGIMAHSSLTAVAEADTFTVQFGTVNYSAAADKQGFAFFDFLFDGKNAGAFTDEELDAAIEPAKQYIYLNDKALSELSGEYYYLQHVKESENRNTLSINLPKLDFIYNWTGTGWNYENSDFSRLDNYKVEVRKGLTIGGKTLAESYVMYYNVDASYQDIERDDDEDEIETFSRISGVASYDNETFFTFVSFTETESEGDEIEEERTFRINLNEGSYVLIEESKEQERHENETEFEYTFIDNYKKVLNYSIEVEHEGHKDSIEYEINDQEYEILKQGDIYIVKIGEDDEYHDEIGRFKKVITEDNTVTFEYIS